MSGSATLATERFRLATAATRINEVSTTPALGGASPLTDVAPAPAVIWLHRCVVLVVQQRRVHALARTRAFAAVVPDYDLLMGVRRPALVEQVCAPHRSLVEELP